MTPLTPPDTTLQPLAIMWAMNHARAIGLRGGLPWHIPEDLKYFKQMTEGHAILMGRRTWDEVGKPLPKRRNIVISRTSTDFPGAESAKSLHDALILARTSDPLPFVIGGAQLYKEALPLATVLFITLVDQPNAEADTFFPLFDETKWHEATRRDGETPGLTFLRLDRIAHD